MAIEKPAGIDAAIDDAARAMTATPAPAALRGAVLARVAAPAGRGLWAWPRLGAVAAAALLVMAGVHWISRPAPVMPASGDPVVAPEAMTAATPDPVAPAAASPPRVARAAPPATVVRRSPVALRRSAGGVVAASTIEVTPVAIAPLSSEGVVVVELVPVPDALDIMPIAVLPLSIGGAGDALEE
jgi:hypothetical protein